MSATVETFISRWQGQEGGAERANYALFLTELCGVLGVEPPQPASAAHTNNDYVFERAVSFKEAGDKIGHGRIDLYKRGHFVLEAKQSGQTTPRAAAAGHPHIWSLGQNLLLERYLAKTESARDSTGIRTEMAGQRAF